MRTFHNRGPLWIAVLRIIETPLFVGSKFTRMVQIADLCSCSQRRYVENGEENLFAKIYTRADRQLGRGVGIRHFTNETCQCAICVGRRA